VSVIDQGKGIAEQDRERVFQRFVRLAEEDGAGEQPAARPSGVGLGLAIARRIAEAHGGSLIVFDSTPGRTEFRLTLPLA
jgi:signal transduction histidine kinase